MDILIGRFCLANIFNTNFLSDADYLSQLPIGALFKLFLVEIDGAIAKLVNEGNSSKNDSSNQNLFSRSMYEHKIPCWYPGLTLTVKVHTVVWRPLLVGPHKTP